MRDPEQEERTRLFERFGKSCDAGETLYVEGDSALQCYMIQEGRIRLIKRIRSSERSLMVLRPGDIFGEEALVEGSTRNASAVAVTAAKVLVLDRATFGALISGSPAAASRVVEQLVLRLRQAEEQLENVMLKDNPSRVVNSLLKLIPSAARTADGYIIQLSPLELSSRVGLDVDTVKSTVAQLRSSGYLNITDEAIVIPSLEPLKRLYDILGTKEAIKDTV